MLKHLSELLVGIFMLLGFAALAFLALKVSGVSLSSDQYNYRLQAEFDNIGGLRVNAPVRLSGVTVGRVSQIKLDPNNYRALVLLIIDDKTGKLPADTSASILTQGLLGGQYIGLTPGLEKETLPSGGLIETTHSALVLENLIGQLLFQLKNDGKKTDSVTPSSG